MTPAMPESPAGVNTIRFGVLKFARFNRLKILARKRRLKRSLTAVFFNVEKSQVARADQSISAQVAIETAVWRGLQKRLRVEPLSGFPRITDP
jgi:hypothetical protein